MKSFSNPISILFYKRLWPGSRPLHFNNFEWSKTFNWPILFIWKFLVANSRVVVEFTSGFCFWRFWRQGPVQRQFVEISSSEVSEKEEIGWPRRVSCFEYLCIRGLRRRVRFEPGLQLFEPTSWWRECFGLPCFILFYRRWGTWWNRINVLLRVSYSDFSQ